MSGSAALVGRLKKLRTVLGCHADPHSCWMLLRSVETMSLRTERAVQNAQVIATYLRDHPEGDPHHLSRLPGRGLGCPRRL